jgi:hypothetical protein
MPLREDLVHGGRGLARKTKEGPQARPLLALAVIYDCVTRTEAAKIGGRPSDHPELGVALQRARTSAVARECLLL